MKPSFKNWLMIVTTLLALTFSALGVTPAYAATITVNNNGDSGTGSLRQAIADAASGSTINFDNDYTITLASQLEIINKTITITGAGHHITISGNNAVRVFHVGSTGGSGNLTIDHLNIVNGKSTINECAGSSEVTCGGGLMLEYLTTATVMNSTFANNDGGAAGGAIYSYYGNPLTVINSTFVNNHTQAYGGAIEFFYGSATLTNNTFVGNTTSGFGSTLLNTWGTVTLRNNIIVKGATNINACDNDFSDGGSTNDGGGNIRFGDATCVGITANPMLGPLDYYGGDVPTLPLLPGSPAINVANANCPALDAHGVTRGTTCESGAFESRGFTLTQTGGNGQSTVINTAFAAPLTLSVTSAFGEPVDGGVVTFTPPATGASAAITGSPATIVSGAVSVTASANNTIGGPYNVTASTAGATSVNFALTNNPPPPTVTTDAASAVTSGSAVLNATVNANNGSAAVTFEYGLDASYGTTVTADQSPVTGATNTAVSKAITGLTPNATYHYRVVAGAVNGDDMTFTTSAIAPTAITNSASAVTSSSAVLNGTVNANHASTVVTFEYGLTTSYGSTVTATQSPLTGTTNTPVSKAITALTPNTSYHYRVVAGNTAGTIYGGDQTFTTTMAAPVATTKAASGVTVYGATLNGMVNAKNASTNVSFQYGLTTAYGKSVAAIPGTVSGTTNISVSKAITALLPNTTYHYRVVAVNGAGKTYGPDQTFKTLAMIERIKNGGFELYATASTNIPRYWSSNSSILATEGKDTVVIKEGTASFKLIGTGRIKTLSQTLTLSGLLGDPFTFSYWTKASALPSTGACRAQVLFYDGAILKGTKTLTCPAGTTYAWQKATLNFTAPADYTEVVITFTFSKIGGMVWFDLASLLR